MRVIQVLFVLLTFLSLLLQEINGRRAIRSGCFCSENECCSKWGYCGITDDYCGKGCQSGPCKILHHVKHSDFHITSEIFACVFSTY